MEHAVHFKAGRLTDTLASLQADIRRKPDDSGLRIALFQLLCVLGQWTRAHSQLGVLRGMGPQPQILASIFEPVLTAELFRHEVFAGKRQPLIFGEPPQWITGMVQALALDAQGQGAAAAAMREAALAAAPAQSGTVNGAPFTWLADADPRLGPVIEAIVEQKYYWIPLLRVAEITVPQPQDMRDLVWTSAHFTWEGGGESDGFIPVRYVGTETHGDDAARLARATSWREAPDGSVTGVGQRMFTTDAAEYGLLDVRTLKLDPVPPAEN